MVWGWWAIYLLQVALLVAAEFWEQGDLERTVLQQNPIVSVCVSMFEYVNVCVSIHARVYVC